MVGFMSSYATSLHLDYSKFLNSKIFLEIFWDYYKQ